MAFVSGSTSMVAPSLWRSFKATAMLLMQLCCGILTTNGASLKTLVEFGVACPHTGTPGPWCHQW
jgi:hypothetical protein